ncbi:MAG: vitamin K epoxide reductase family protein [Candidatus Sumerlaeia bacterium]|nr:vitamin K epoxide reductase family protein [Candidatus Sumerlaeia bacterium]
MAPRFTLHHGRILHAPDMGGGSHGQDKIPPPPQWLLEDLDDQWIEEQGPPQYDDQYPQHDLDDGSEQDPYEYPTDRNDGLEPDADLELGSWEQPAPQYPSIDPPTREEIHLQPQEWEEEEAPQANYDDLYGATPPPPPPPPHHRESTPQLTPGHDPEDNLDPSFESSDQFSLPTRIDNPIPTDLPSAKDLLSTKTPMALSGSRNPGILDEDQLSHPSYKQPSTKELAGGGIPDPPTQEPHPSFENQYSGFGSELAKANPASGIPLGRAESLGVDPDTGTDPKTDAGNKASIWGDDSSKKSRNTEPDPGVLGWRFAGATWLVFSILMAIPFLNSGVSVITTASIFGPLGVLGLILLSGWRWTGLLALGAATVYSMFFGFLGYLLIFDIHTLTVIGDIGQLPPEYGIGMMVIGASFLFSNVLLLVAAPESTRAVLGSLITLVPTIAAVGFFLFGDTKPRLHTPLIGYSPAEFESREPRFRFIKPAGWTVYHWEDIRDHSRLGRGLTTEPDFYFVDQEQSLLFKIYIKEPPRRSLADLLGGPTLTPLEIEATRGFAPTQSQPDTFPFKGTDITITESIHEGVLEDDTSLSVILDRTEVAGKMLLIVMTRDIHSGVSHTIAERELNKFYKDLEFVP